MRENDMKTKMVSYTLEALPSRTAADDARLDALFARPESEINLTDPDAPELGDDNWQRAVRGKYYRPVKAQVTTKLDADVIDWLKRGGKGYQTRMNAILRRAMLEERKAG
jgi:uncharacterized protein (DUF4415 family)